MSGTRFLSPKISFQTPGVSVKGFLGGFGMIMIFYAGLCPASYGAPSESEARSLLQRAFSPMESAYSGKISVLQEGAKFHRKLIVRQAPGGLNRREMPDSKGKTLRIYTFDGKSIWIYDKVLNVAWQGVASPEREGASFSTRKEIELLLKNYPSRILSNGGRIARRPCRIVEIQYPEGSPMRRLWLDQQYGLILASKSYSKEGNLVASMRFVSIEFYSHFNDDLFRFPLPSGVQVIHARTRPNYLQLDRRLSGGHALYLPSSVPEGFELINSNLANFKGTNVFHTQFSDGVRTFSLFQCPGRVRLLELGKESETMHINKGTKAMFFESVSAPMGQHSSGENVFQWRWRHHQFILVGPLRAEAFIRIAESIP